MHFVLSSEEYLLQQYFKHCTFKGTAKSVRGKKQLCQISLFRFKDCRVSLFLWLKSFADDL